MPNYIYKALDQSGNKIKDKIEAANKETVVSMLKTKGLFVVTVEEEDIFSKDIELFSNSAFSTKGIAIFARQFAILLKSGISITGSLDILREQLENKIMARTVNTVYQEVQKGTALSTALRNTKKFPDLLVNTIEAGEAGGNMEDVMERMANYYEKSDKTASKVKSALIYPCMVLLVTIIVTYILLTQVVPTFAEMFSSLDLELPLLTRMLMAVGEFFNTYWIPVFGVLAALIAILFYYLRTPEGKFRKDLLMMSIPLVKSLVQKSAIAKFARTMSIMLRTGIPMINALELSSKVVNNVVMTRALIGVKAKVEAGSNLSAPIEEMKVFPKLVVSMIKIGEETGALDEMLNKCADFYDDEVDTVSARITSMIEPMVIIILALIVGTIVMAIIQPMFQMYESLM
ncbi:MAG: type II secretion system F family protein [Clostridiales bacterium]|nr:type II secretion system F family protein [Clostridiales bacterium]